jgi:lysophospholipase L1-like esterase
MEHFVRSVRLWLSVVVLLALAAAMLGAAQPAAARQLPPTRGLVVTEKVLPGGPAIELTSPERFALTIDGAGIAAWYDLAGDPLRNLAPPGGHLVAHQSATGEPFAGTARLVEANAVRAVVELQGQAGAAPASISLTVWAGGQVAIATRGAAGVGAALQLDPRASTGAALLPTGAGPAGGDWAASYTLYLGAWTPDSAVPNRGGVIPVAPAPAAADEPLLLAPPAGVLRQPRFVVAGWPRPEHGLSLAGQPLVEGVDYLAHWDAASGELILQYLGLLPPGDAASRTFSLSPAQAPAIAVEILNRAGSAPRPLTPDGLLLVDANLPSAVPNEPATTKDIFAVPYIQTWPELRLRATLSEGPAGLSGVRFSASGPGFSQSSDDTDGADGYSAQFNLPRRAEYSVSATALLSGQPAEPSKTIAQVAYGRVFLTVGDSITAGKWGFYRRPGDDGYPFTAPPASGGPYPRSADGRNYPQSDNSNDDLLSGVAGYENTYYQGYQVELNSNLSGCLNSPVFLLNSGISGIRTARDAFKAANPNGNGYGANGELNVLGKADAYRSQLAQLGAEHLLLQIGTNDASTVTSSANQMFNDPLPGSVYNQDLRSVVAALRQESSGLNIWLGQLPWRDDKRSDDPEAVREERRLKTLEFNGAIAAIVGDLGVSTPTFLGPDWYAAFDNGVDRQLMIATDPTSGNPDRLHPTAAGYTLMAQQWASAICGRIPAEPNPGDPDPKPERIYLPALATRP